LYKKTDKDEQGNTVITYNDKQGRLVQKEQQLNATDYAITAYIYNNLGQLAFIVQPEAYNTAISFDKNSTIFTLGVFGYEYDERGRQIAKHVPSGGWTNLVYDKLNREVLSQTELQRPDNKWRFIKFDAFNRTIQKGDLTNASSRNDLQNLFNAITNAFEEGSSNQSFPSSVSSSPTQQREAFIYDDYGFIAGEWAFNRANTYHDNYANAKGLLTGAVSWNSGDFSKVYHTVYHYDSKGRVIQTYQTHPLGGSQPWTKANIGNFYYNFNGQVLIDMKIQQKDNAPTIEDKTENEYDHVGRLTKVFHGINGNRFEVVRLTYDQVGRLKQKKFRADENFLIGGTLDYINRPPSPSPNIDDIARKAIFLNVGTVIDAKSINKYSATINPNSSQGVSISGLQTMDFSHHIRGGLRGINLDVSGNPTPNATEGDLFSYKLDYETAGFYDGNIGKQSWQTTANNSPVGVRSFTFGYDVSSRLKYANYSGLSGESFGLPNINYDKNSNITNLQRNGKKGSGYGDIDNLTYTYTGNRLNTVTDGVSGNHEVDLIQRGGGNYTYYNDGSLKSDENKEITNIIYDSYLDKPKEVQLTGSRWVKMSYDGGGSLLKREFSTGEYWDFVNNTIYKNGVLYQMGTPEGRAVYQNSNWQYEFFYQDHLSNARVSFGANGQNLVTNDVTDFDPTGIPLSGTGVENSVENRFKFLNRERVPTFDLGVYQLGARMYDPQRMQFWSTDPLIDEGQHSFTPFHYSFNNPIRFSDPSGLMGEPCCGDGADGIGNGMSLVENIYYSTRDLLTSSIATIGTAFASVFSDVKPQRINATYSSGSRALSSEVIPKGEVAQEVAMSTLSLASAIPSGGSAGTGMLMAKAGTKTSTGSSVVKTIKEQAEDLVAANGGKNRVTLRSEKAQTDVDLRGEAHFDKKTTTTYDTPHTKTSPRNMQAPVNQGARYNTTEKHANYNNTTQREIRTLRKYLEKQQ
jgi:RHS repeat-associated protein